MRQGPRRTRASRYQIHLFTQQLHERTSTPTSSRTWSTSVQPASARDRRQSVSRRRRERAAPTIGEGSRRRSTAGGDARTPARPSHAPRANPQSDTRARVERAAPEATPSRPRRPSAARAVVRRPSADGASAAATAATPAADRRRRLAAPPRDAGDARRSASARRTAAIGRRTMATVDQRQISGSAIGTIETIAATVADRGERGGDRDGGFQDRRNGRRHRRGRGRGPRANAVAAAAAEGSRRRAAAATAAAPQQPVQIIATGETRGWFDAARDAGFIRRPATAISPSRATRTCRRTSFGSSRFASADLIDATIGIDPARPVDGRRDSHDQRRRSGSSRRGVRTSIRCPRRIRSGSCSWRRDVRRRAAPSSRAARSI